MNERMRPYAISAAIVWVAIILAASSVMAGADRFPVLLAILGGGAVWFVVLVPGWLLRR